MAAEKYQLPPHRLPEMFAVVARIEATPTSTSLAPTLPITTAAATAAPQTSPPLTNPAATSTPVVPVTAVPTMVTEYSGTFIGRDHPTSGNALVLGDGSGQRFLRFDLGTLKGNIGDQNYEVPADADLAVYDTVLIWCVRFSSPFGEVTLAAT